MLTARPAVLSDSEWLLALRNDRETVRQSIWDAAITNEMHDDWFARAMTDPARALMVVETRVIQAGRVATYRLDRIGTEQIEVSLTVAPGQRGRGFAAHVIDLAARHAMREGPESIIALVKRGNTRSLRAFLRAGFRLNPPSTDDGDLLLLAARPEDIAGRVCSLCARGVEHHTNAADSIGGDEGRTPRYDLHVGIGGVLVECEAGDLWLAWQRGRSNRLDVHKAEGSLAGSTPAASTKHQPCMDADCITCRSSAETTYR